MYKEEICGPQMSATYIFLHPAVILFQISLSTRSIHYLVVPLKKALLETELFKRLLSGTILSVIETTVS